MHQLIYESNSFSKHMQLLPVPEEVWFCPERLARQEVQVEDNIKCVEEKAEEVKANGYQCEIKILPIIIMIMWDETFNSGVYTGRGGGGSARCR